MDGPRITAVAPFTLTPGQATTLHVRGLKLDTATALIVQPAAGVVVEKGEAKKSPPPNGADAKKYGDTEVEMKVTAPASATPIQLIIETSAGRTPAVSLPVIAASDSIEEKEPNGGFREAQPIEFGKVVRGCINADKDVDVYRMEGKRGMKVAIVAEAARWPSLADPMLTVFSASGQIVATGSASPALQGAGAPPPRGSTKALVREESPSSGSSGRGRPGSLDESGDCRVLITLPANGVYYLSVVDAQDTGGPWHCYHLTVKEAP